MILRLNTSQAGRSEEVEIIELEKPCGIFCRRYISVGLLCSMFIWAAPSSPQRNLLLRASQSFEREWIAGTRNEPRCRLVRRQATGSFLLRCNPARHFEYSPPNPHYHSHTRSCQTPPAPSKTLN